MRQLELYRYNPGQCEPEDLKATFVGREVVLENILNVLRERAKSSTNQHFLIVGPRGIGKTNLLLMTKYSVEDKSALANAYLPLQTAEEEYSIVSLRDFFEKILELLLGFEVNDDLITAAKSATSSDDDEQVVEIAIEALKKYVSQSNKKILLLLDNFDLILNEKVMDKAQSGRLRDVLMNQSFLTIVAAAPTHFKEVSGHDRPFYQFFHTIELEDLPIEKIEELLKRQAEIENNQPMLDSFNELKPSIRAVHHMTGGNPRLVLMLYQLYSRSELPEVRAAIRKLLDDITPYYKHRIEELPIQQRKILDTFARLGRPATPTELAQETRLPVNQVNSIIKRLGSLGFVSKSPQQRRKTTYYMVSERVFRIWHQMRFSPAGKRKLEFFIEFLRIWYSENEWQKESSRLLKDYASHAFKGEYRKAERSFEHLEYMAEAAPKEEMRYEIMDSTIRVSIESHDFKKAEKTINEQIKEYTREGNNDLLAQSWFLMGYLRDVEGKRDEEIKALKKAVKLRPEFHEALYNWGVILTNLAVLEEGEEREELFMQAIEKYESALKAKSDKHDALSNWGTMLTYLAYIKEGEEREQLLRSAIEKYEAAVKVEPHAHEALNNWGASLSDLAVLKEGEEQQKFFENALGKIHEAITIVSGSKDSRNLLYSAHHVHVALLYCRSAVIAQNYGQARRIFMSAIEKCPMAQEDLLFKEFFGFFTNTLNEQTVEICGEFFGLMEKKKMENVLQVLDPIRIAMEYWRKDEKNREEVLDRLNPEVREVVEKIIQKK